MHKHSLIFTIPHSTRVLCEGCPEVFRLASYDEAVFVHMTDTYLPDGPFLCDNDVVVVPLDFTLFLKEHTDANSP